MKKRKRMWLYAYSTILVFSVLIVTVYGLLLKFNIISSVFAMDAVSAGSDIPVVSAVHNVKAYLFPEYSYDPGEFIPPEGMSVSADMPAAEIKAKETTETDTGRTEVAGAEVTEDAVSAKAVSSNTDTDTEIEEETEDKKDEENEQDKEETGEITEIETDDGCYSPYGEFAEVTDEYFNEETLFIGDSRTKGFLLYSELPLIKGYADSGYAVYSVFKRPIIKTPVGNFTLDQALALEPMKYKKVYLMFGLNEMGWGNDEMFAQCYYNLIDMVKYFDPEAVIYVQAIPPVTKEKSEESALYNNEKITARNEALKEIAKNEHVCYLNLGKVFEDEEGNMPSEYSSDGIHFKAQYIQIWKDYLKQHAIVSADPGE
ncbi:MAG: hypothetical protein K6F99_01225 [Lachnospiraceae bacterium]|nr:hypothetical protein [Lachnospiraceae bacterium]